MKTNMKIFFFFFLIIALFSEQCFHLFIYNYLILLYTYIFGIFILNLSLNYKY